MLLIIGGLLGGWFLSDHFHQSALWVPAGAALGLGGGLWHLYQQTLLANLTEAKKEEEETTFQNNPPAEKP